MPRPKKCRRICALPRTAACAPVGCRGKAQVEMSVDEFEAVRLIDLLGCTQDEAAARMGVARTTVQAVYNCARGKLADMLVNGKRLQIGGGDYMLCPRAEGCPAHGASGGCHCGGCRRTENHDTEEPI